MGLQKVSESYIREEVKRHKRVIRKHWKDQGCVKILFGEWGIVLNGRSDGLSITLPYHVITNNGSTYQVSNLLL